MGRARIISGGPDARYAIEVDVGAAQKAQLLAAVAAAKVKNDALIVQQQAEIDIADARESAQRIKLAAAREAYIVESQALPPGAPRPSSAPWMFELKLLRDLQRKHAPLRLSMQRLKFERQALIEEDAKWNAFNPLITRDAWCADMTDTKPAGSFVGVLEVKGEQDLILIKPSAPNWVAADGLLRARDIMTPWQAYANAAILPGWQKYKPTFRTGTILELDKPANKATVELNAHTSSAQRLPIDQKQRLVDVPVTYMQCHAEAFEVGNRVVVMFDGQNQTLPRVIGFVDNPKPCNWPCFSASGGFVYFGSRSSTIFDLMLSTATTVKLKFSGGGWQDVPLFAIGTIPGQQIYYRTTSVPSDHWDFTQLFIRRSVSPFNGFTDYLGVGVSPFFPATTTRNVAEFAVYAGGRLVCNLAATDRGLSGSPTYRTGLVKTPGGISLAGASEPVGVLEYTLTGV